MSPYPITGCGSEPVLKGGEITDDVFGEVICSYIRAHAIEDGMLVDVSALAKEAGFRYPMAVTARV